MTVTNEVRSVRYIGDGVTTGFAYSFLIPTSSEIVVRIYDTVTETWSTVSSSNYSVSGIGVPAGGTVTYPVSGSPLAATEYIYIQRVVGYTQDMDISENGGYDSEVLESQLDDLVFQIQQVKDAVAGAPRLEAPDAFSNTLPPKEQLYGKVVVHNASTGEPEAGPTAADIAAAQTYATNAAASASAAAASAALAGVPFASRAAAQAGTVDASATHILVIHAGEVLAYQKDASGTALTTADGANWSPADKKTVKHYGAVGDGSTNDSTALQAAHDDAAGDELIYNEGGNYVVTTGITVTDAATIIRGYGATLTQGADIIPLTLAASVDTVTAASSLSNTATVDVSAGGGVSTPVASVTFGSAHSFSVGDIVKVTSDNDWPDTGVTGQLWGEVARVIATTSTVIYLSRRFVTQVPSSPTDIRVCKLGTERMEIHGLSFDTAAAGDGANWTAQLLKLNGLVGPVLRDIHIVKGWAIAIAAQGCTEIDAVNITGGPLTNDPSNSRYGYLINDVSGHGNSWKGLVGKYCRHVYTTNQQTTSAASDMRLYGQTVGCMVTGSMGLDCSGSAFDTHHDAVNVMFVACTAISAVRGEDGVGSGFQIRGRGCSIKDCQSIGTKVGVQVLQQYATNATRDVTIDGFNSNTPDAGILINGQSGNVITNVTIRNCNMENHDHDHLIEGVYFIARISNCQMRMVNALANVYPITADAGATIYADHIHFDCNDLTGTYVYLFGVFQDDSLVHIWDCTVEGNWRGVFDFNSNDGEGIAYTPIRADTSPTNLGAIGGTGGTPTAGIDYYVGRGETTNFVRFDQTFSSSGNKDVDLGYRSCRMIYLRITTSASGSALNTVTDGVFIGQMLCISLVDSSSHTFNVNANSGGGLALNTAETITIGRGMTLVWDGSVWRPVTGG